ncbi:MAG: hypothetical protein R6U84_05750 [Candidatus Cloacimonadales bacterium]
MNKEMKKFFQNLVEAPSPSGFEQPAQEVYRKFTAPYADEIKTDVHGNVIALKKGTGKLKFMVVGHADEIGLMVNYIDENGFIRFLPIGGVDTGLLPGSRVDIYGKENKLYRGVIGRKPIHVLKPDERSKATKIEDLWIDIGAKDKKDAETKVEIGSHITFSKGMEMLSKDIVTTKATDNKAGVYIVGALLKELGDEKIVPNIYMMTWRSLRLTGSTSFI